MCGSTSSTPTRRRGGGRWSISAARCCCCCRSCWCCCGSRCPTSARSWAILETSRETSGLPVVYLLKTLDPAVRRADGAAGHRAGDPRRARAASPVCQRSMMHPELLAILMVVAVCGLLFFGYPVALTLGGVSLAFAALGHLTGAMGFSFIGALPQRVYGVMTNEVLLAIPLFIFMGVMLERSRVAEELLETMGRLFGTLARRPRHFRRHRRHAARRRQGRGRRHHGDDGPDRAADHAAPRLRQAARRRHRRRDRDAWRRFSRPRPCWCCSATSSRPPIRRRSSSRAISRRRR